MTHTHMKRSQFHHDRLTLSYLDTGGDSQTLIALHAHWMEAVTYTRFAAALAPEWRVIALDQRGHGHSDHAPGYTREDYLGDLTALFEHLEIDKAVLLGNSLGGVNAYQFAARHPERVKALVVPNNAFNTDSQKRRFRSLSETDDGGWIDRVYWESLEAARASGAKFSDEMGPTCEPLVEIGSVVVSHSKTHVMQQG